MIKPLTITHPINFKAHHANLIEHSDEIRNSLGYYNHTTCFFRYNNHDDNTDYFVINSLKENKSKKPLEIVSLGCSFGEEVYSYALGLDDLAKKANIVGIDISPDAISDAQIGEYRLDFDEKDLFINRETRNKDKSLDEIISKAFSENFETSNLFGSKYKKKEGHLENCEFLVSDIDKMKEIFKPNSKDVVLCRFVFYHFDDDMLKVLNSILQSYEILKPGGLFCLSKGEYKHYEKAVTSIGFKQPYKEKPWIFQKPETKIQKIKRKLGKLLNHKSNF